MDEKYFPRRLSFPKICDVLIAYLNAGADKGYVGVKDVVERTDVSLHNISRNNNFFRSWGFLEESEEEPGKYILSREAAEFAYAYRIDPKGEKTRELLRKILSKDEVLVKFIERVRREGLGRDDILIELPRIYGDLRADKVGLNAFLDMIMYAFGLEGKAAEKPVREVRRPSVKATIKPSEIGVRLPNANFTININVSSDVSPERLKEYVRAILEALRGGMEGSE
ncbi:hypothetical protein J7L18_09530 [Candidatus Bathyarchaeota archaeon]|nr:hypothetical protein [Candidatus Bathyarchaeota archaeon]